ncbi:MAG: TAXI family TRAP transporter solute-binding subunit [Alphaproteobacteria bacterium]|nr:TAXI family TRAP transporter solute-binding subunit [Alphaproteobacteria bacterium]
MTRHRAMRTAVAAVVALALPTAGRAQGAPPRLSFQVATGSTAGTYFPMGELIAGIVSHPPGLPRCDAGGVCGPLGLIVSARTSAGAVANVLAVNAGAVDSGLAQANVVADALAGTGAFHQAGRQTHIRTIANLFPETVQLVVAAKAPIAKLADLRGKRVSIGAEGAGAGVAAREILAAYHIAEWRLDIRRDSYDVDASLLLQGKIDAFFYMGAAPSEVVNDLVASRSARLIAIGGKARGRLFKRDPSFSAYTIPADTYPGSGAIETVSCRTLWIVKDSAPPGVVYGMLRALFHPANRALLDSGERSARYIRLDQAAEGLTAPLHPGAARYFREMGKLADLKAERRD